MLLELSCHFLRFPHWIFVVITLLSGTNISTLKMRKLQLAKILWTLNENLFVLVFQSDSFSWCIRSERIHPGERKSVGRTSCQRSRILQAPPLVLTLSVVAWPRLLGHNQPRAAMHPQGVEVHHKPDETQRWGLNFNTFLRRLFQKDRSFD